MSDLIERLRDPTNSGTGCKGLVLDAADRIEQLEAARKNWYCELCGCPSCLDAEDALAALNKEDNDS